MANLAHVSASPIFFGLNEPQSEGGGGGGSSPVSSLFEDFEDTTVGWSVDGSGGGTIDLNDDASPLSGSYSLTIQPSSVETYDAVKTPELTPLSSIEVSFEYDTDTAANYDVDFVALYNSSDAQVAYARLMTNGRYEIGQGVTTSLSSNDEYDHATKTYIWFEYTKGAGSDAVVNFYWADTDTKPVSAGLSITTGTATTDITYVKFMNRNRGVWVAYFDNINIE